MAQVQPELGDNVRVYIQGVVDKELVAKLINKSETNGGYYDIELTLATPKLRGRINIRDYVWDGTDNCWTKK